MDSLPQSIAKPTTHRATYQSLVWPRWTQDEELITLLTEFGPAFTGTGKNQLVLYANPRKDGTREECAHRIQRILNQFPAFQNVNLTLLHCVLTQAVVHQLRRTLSSGLIVPSAMLPDRAALYRVLGLTGLPDRTSAMHEQEAWQARKQGIRLSWAPKADSSLTETSILTPDEAMPGAQWWARHDAKSETHTSPRLAVIVPYRDRAAHLAQFGPYIHHYLKDIPHRVFIVEQDDNKPFNRGKLLNIGVHLLKDCYDFFALHDVDHFPVHVDYRFPDHPVHLAARSSMNNFEVMYETYMGGVLLINREDYLAINGFSNSFWGWGAEDDDLYLRMKTTERFPSRRDGLYDCLPHLSNAFQHDHYVDNVRQMEEMRRGEVNQHQNGLSTLHFSLTGASQNQWFTRFKVAV